MELNPKVWVIDSTKMGTYMDCPRKFLFEHVLGWSTEEPSYHLTFGIAWHEAMEVLINSRKDRDKPGYDSDVVPAAFDAFMASFRERCEERNDELYAPKTPDNAARALDQYIRHFYQDNFKPIYVEISGSVPVSAGRHGSLPFFYRIDAVVEDARGTYFMEHKTSSRGGVTWQAEWVQALQPGLYMHVLRAIGLENAFGVINGAFLRNAPKLKKNGEPYAGSRDNEFLRVIIKKSNSQMHEWFLTLEHWLERLFDDLEKLAYTPEHHVLDQEVLVTFPKQPRSCTKYGICPYFDICTASPNPVAWESAHQLPTGYVHRFWDPRELDTEGTTVINVEGDSDGSTHPKA